MRIILFVALTVLIYSCSGNADIKQTDSGVKIKEILLVSNSDSLITKISEIASDIDYIPLQRPANTRIRSIDKIMSRGNKIYISLVDDLLCFNDKGQFLYQLYGRGKKNGDEVVAVYDFDIDKADTTLIVLYGNMLLHFKNTDSGFEYVNSLKLGIISPLKLNFVPGTSKILLSVARVKGSEPSVNMMISINRDNLNFKPYYFRSFNSIEKGFGDDFVHYQFTDTLYFKERFNDTVFLVNPQSNKFTPALILNSRLSSTTSENINDPDYYKLLPFVVNIFEVPGYLYYDYSISSKSHKVFYGKSDNKKYEIDTENGYLKDDIAGGPDFDLAYCSEGKIYSWTSASELKKYIESEEFAKAKVLNPKKKDDLRSLANSMKETDNPVLIVVTPKK